MRVLTFSKTQRDFTDIALTCHHDLLEVLKQLLQNFRSSGVSLLIEPVTYVTMHAVPRIL